MLFMNREVVMCAGMHAGRRSPTPAFSSPEMVACTSVSGQSSRLWPCTSGELAADASTGRVGLVGVLPVVLKGDLYGLLSKGKVQQ